MDLNTFRSIMTLLALLMFVGVVLWAYSGRRRDAFREAANLPFADDDTPSGETAGRAMNAGEATTTWRQQ